MKKLFTVTIALSFLSFAPRGHFIEERPAVSASEKVSDAPLLLSSGELLKAGQLDNLFDELHARNKFNGAVLVAEQGRIIFKKAYGYCDAQKLEPITTSSAFQLASVSKTFTSTAVLMLCDSGVVQLDAHVKEYLPEFPYPSITVRQLLTHRSGLPDYIKLSKRYWDENIPMSNEDMLRMFVQRKPRLVFSPDTRFKYCNTNFAMLALIVKHVAHVPFDEFVQHRIFDPLEMTHSFVYSKVNTPDAPSDVVGLRRTRKGLYEAENTYLNGVVGDKGVYSTVEDLFKFDQALYTEKLVRQSILAQAFAPGSKEFKSDKKNYGLGWRIKQTENEKIVYHMGLWGGFHTCFMRFLNEQKTIIILNNRDKERIFPIVAKMNSLLSPNEEE